MSLPVHLDEGRVYSWSCPIPAGAGTPSLTAASSGVQPAGGKAAAASTQLLQSASPPDLVSALGRFHVTEVFASGFFSAAAVDGLQPVDEQDDETHPHTDG